jgi:phage-related protein
MAGRVAIVTGASRGIGQAIAELLAHEGARVVCVARTSNESRYRRSFLCEANNSLQKTLRLKYCYCTYGVQYGLSPRHRRAAEDRIDARAARAATRERRRDEGQQLVPRREPPVALAREASAGVERRQEVREGGAVCCRRRDVRDRVLEGHGERTAQTGDLHESAKPLKGFGGAGVVEIVNEHRSDTYRCIYTVRFAGSVYVLHAFQKKSKKGRETPKAEIELIRRRLREAERIAKGEQPGRIRRSDMPANLLGCLETTVPASAEPALTERKRTRCQKSQNCHVANRFLENIQHRRQVFPEICVTASHIAGNHRHRSKLVF